MDLAGKFCAADDIVDFPACLRDLQAGWSFFSAVDWQDSCLIKSMNEPAYDISHLLEQELSIIAAPSLRIVAAPPDARTADASRAEDQLARELLQSSAIHDAFIDQYLRMAVHTATDVWQP